MKVMIAGRDISHLEKTVEEIRAMGAQGVYQGCDVSKSEDVEVLVKDAVACGDGQEAKKRFCGTDRIDHMPPALWRAAAIRTCVCRRTRTAA